MNNYRIIKFRIWNGHTKKWIHGPNKRSDLDGVNLFGETILFGALMDGVSLDELNDCSALQFTGLKDKNGKDIFEGDILRIPENDPESTGSHELVFVEYKYSSFGYTDTYTKRFDSIYSLIGDSQTDDCAEVIGNIYDNPELIK